MHCKRTFIAKAAAITLLNMTFILCCFCGIAPSKTIFSDNNWQYQPPASLADGTLTIPSAASGVVQSGEFKLPGQRTALLVGLDFKVTKDFSLFKFLHVKLEWLDKSNRVIGRHRQHPWFSFPPRLLYGKWMPFHRLIEPDAIPASAVAARIHFTFKSAGKNARGNIELKNITVKSMCRVRGDTFANWFEKGQPVCFKGNLPEDATAAKGIVYNSESQKVAEEKVDGDSFKKHGLSFDINSPGFYTVKFYYDTDTKKNIPWIEEYYAQLIKGLNLCEEQKYSRDLQHFAVTATPPRAPKDVSPAFGSSSMSMYKRNLPYKLGTNQQDSFDAAKAIGANFTRCFIDWDKVETQPGKYDWKATDEYFAFAAKNGFDQSRIDAGILNTPRFYTSRPPNKSGQPYSERYQFYPPNDMKVFGKFVTAAVKHYPGVPAWEIWNEPHLPGYSIFWKSTPEVYVEMLKTGYNAIKSVDPQKQVALGGIGQRYLPFYDKILSLGAGNYFDITPLHGVGNIVKDFKTLERKHKARPKRFIANEWHPYILLSTNPDLPSEELRAFNITLDLLNMLRNGVEKVAIYGGFNSAWHGGNEREMIPLRKKQGAQLAGVFRTYPNQEPKYVAIVLRNFIDRFAGKITFKKAFILDKGKIQCAWLSSKKGSVLAFWTKEKKPVVLSGKSKQIIGNSQLLDDQGRKFTAGSKIIPQHIYYALNPNTALLQTMKNSLRKIEQYTQKKVMENKYQSFFRPGKLFDGKMNLIDPKSLPWTSTSQYYSFVNLPKPKEFNARFAVGITQEKFQLCVEVNDPVHNDAFDKKKKINPWDVDSVQFAIDCEGKGNKKTMTEIIALNNYLVKFMIASVEGDLPDKFTPRNENIKYGNIKVTRKGSKTIYKISIDASELYPYLYSNSPTLRFSLLINANNGRGREGYLSWSGGIGDMKEPTKFGTLTRQTDGREVGNIKSTHSAFQKAKVTDNPDGTISVKATGLKAGQAGGSGVTYSIKVTPGVKYTVSFEARGKGGKKLESFLAGNNIPRTNIGFCMLDSKWHKFTGEIIIPPKTESLRTYIFTWCQPDSSFDVRNFSVKESLKQKTK